MLSLSIQTLTIKPILSKVEGFSSLISLSGIAIVFLITVIIEFLIMFSGVTLFNTRMNLVQILFHSAAIISSGQFILDKGDYNQLWKIWIVGG